MKKEVADLVVVGMGFSLMAFVAFLYFKLLTAGVNFFRDLLGLSDKSERKGGEKE